MKQRLSVQYYVVFNMIFSFLQFDNLHYTVGQETPLIKLLQDIRLSCIVLLHAALGQGEVCHISGVGLIIYVFISCVHCHR